MLGNTRLIAVASIAAANIAVADDLATTLGLADEALALGRQQTVWPGLRVLQDGFVLIDGDREVAVCFDEAPGFDQLPTEDTADCRRHGRTRVFPRQMQASLNLFGTEETVVTADPESLGQSATDWQLLFLHERFHQWQSTLPNYAASVAALELSGDDETGMWMLTFPFPYEDRVVGERFSRLCRDLAQLFTASTLTTADLTRYRALRDDAFATLSADQRRYAEFQLWKEGAARWTELALADAFATRAQADSKRFAEAAAARRARIETILNEHSFASAQRGLFYALGAAEWDLVERIDPTWRDRYGLAERFVMDRALTGKSN